MTTARAQAAIDQVLQLQDFFDRSALAQPDAIAVEVPPAAERPQRRRITYGELKHRSDLLAGRIRDTVAESSVVAVLLPRTTELLHHPDLLPKVEGTIQAFDKARATLPAGSACRETGERRCQ